MLVHQSYSGFRFFNRPAFSNILSRIDGMCRQLESLRHATPAYLNKATKVIQDGDFFYRMTISLENSQLLLHICFRSSKKLNIPISRLESMNKRFHCDVADQSVVVIGSLPVGKQALATWTYNSFLSKHNLTFECCNQQQYLKIVPYIQHDSLTSYQWTIDLTNQLIIHSLAKRTLPRLLAPSIRP